MTQGSDLKFSSGRWYSPSLGSVGVFHGGLLDVPKGCPRGLKSVCVFLWVCARAEKYSCFDELNATGFLNKLVINSWLFLRVLNPFYPI